MCLLSSRSVPWRMPTEGWMKCNYDASHNFGYGQRKICMIVSDGLYTDFQMELMQVEYRHIVN
ncbi:predicted protein [Arabidopsis lyrata subsp. lyrata]|uniref:Predicted protein n=1 Tax=Arabidopsis lyrata subsp. lyrata TaxID=81972 RepID=D7LSF7_ARALL|nr:predicted protein [Arabidopsis lyrata subsp. lyrata]